MLLITGLMSTIGSGLTLMTAFYINLRTKPTFILVGRPQLLLITSVVTVYYQIYCGAVADMIFGFKFFLTSVLVFSGVEGVQDSNGWQCWVMLLRYIASIVPL